MTDTTPSTSEQSELGKLENLLSAGRCWREARTAYMTDNSLTCREYGLAGDALALAISEFDSRAAVAPPHHKHCSIWTVRTDGKKNPCDCVCQCEHSMGEHIRPGEHYWYEDCAAEACPCMKFTTAPPVDAEKVAQRRLEIALGYIKRAANRELPKLPYRVDEMSKREVAIFNVGTAAVGNLQFIARELDALDATPSLPSAPEDASMTPAQLERAVLIATSREIDLPTAEELVYLRDRVAALPSVVVPTEDDGWVTFGRIKVDIENETETFERIDPATPVVPEGEQDGEIVAALNKHLAQRHEELATHMRKVCAQAIELIEQYTRPDFYMWLLHDHAGQKSDPFKRAAEARALLQELIDSQPGKGREHGRS